jgi:hypothetical protein
MKNDHYYRELDRRHEEQLEKINAARKRIELHKKAERWRQILDQAGVENTAELIKQEIEERLRDDD